MSIETRSTVIMGIGKNHAPKVRSFNREPQFSDGSDCPALSENPLNLFTLAYSLLIEGLADSFFPPTQVESERGNLHHLRASDARVDRHIHFRAAWQPTFADRLQLALRDLTQSSINRHAGRHFTQLSDAERETLLLDLQAGRLSTEDWISMRSQIDAFASIHDAISCGVVAEPGYGGNAHGIGWFYTRFMTIED